MNSYSEDDLNILLKLIQNKRNLGYCGGNNVGIREAKGKFIVILNPDTIVESNWINELMMIPANDLHCFLFLLQSNSLLHTVVVIYRFVVVFLDLASFWFK